MRLLLAGLLGCLTLLQASGQSVAGSFAIGSGLEGGAFTLYDETQTAPVLQVRLDKVYTDYETKGFFRIGILPLAVLEGVSFQLEPAASVTNSLAQMHRWLGGGAARRLELRRVSLLISGPITNRLEAGRVRLAGAGQLDLLDGVRFATGTNQLYSAGARLQATGPQAGRLILEGAPPRTNSLFGCTDIPKPMNQQDLK